MLAGDLLAGVTVASMLIPQSVSYATSLAKLTPTAGLFSASIPPIVYALLGSSRQLNVAPEAALSLLLGQAVQDVHNDYPGKDYGIPVATVITLQVGLISFLLGFFRLGFIDVILSRALLRGFVAAIAVVIMIEQLIPMFGLVPLEHSLHPESTIDKFFFLIRHAPTDLHGPTTVISFSALAVLVLLRTLKTHFKPLRRFPEVLLVVILSTILSSYLRFDKSGVDILGSVPLSSSHHFFQSPFHHGTLRFLKRTTSTALLISVIGFLDSIVAAKQSASRFGYSVSPNRELVALGAGNLAASFVPGTLPAYGSITRTKINGDCGARTQLSSIICASIILFATFFLLPYLYFLPKCVLASIILLVVWSLILETPHDLIYYYQMNSRMDILLCFVTFFGCVVWNVEVGIVTSLLMSLVMVVRRSGRVRMVILGRIPGTMRWKPIGEDNPDAVELGDEEREGEEGEEETASTLIVRIKETQLDFANTSQLKERLRRLELYGLTPAHPSDDPRRKEARTVILHMADVESVDAIAAQIIKEVVGGYKSRNTSTSLIFTHVRPSVFQVLERAGVVDMVGREEGFKADVEEAVRSSGGGYRDSLGEGGLLTPDREVMSPV
ncbi:hypothetical protein V5O48_002183 [Marasmius crinis-equi]|uniref:STAS domain-containing protein n=1 Tax=Marasmius crinis-equi TaxID=585013 RepID=A0ABR3FXI1_9AGAR